MLLSSPKGRGLRRGVEETFLVNPSPSLSPSLLRQGYEGQAGRGKIDTDCKSVSGYEVGGGKKIYLLYYERMNVPVTQQEPSLVMPLFKGIVLEPNGRFLGLLT